MKKIIIFIVAHNEGLRLVQSVRSAQNSSQEVANHAEIQILIILENANELTKQVAYSHAGKNISVTDINFSNLDSVRNTCISLADGFDYYCFLEAGNLFGSNWIGEALVISEENENSIIHPKFNLFFGNNGFNITESCSSISANFDKYIFTDSNLWTSSVFSSLTIFKQFTFPIQNSGKNIELENWSWNMLTLKNGIKHLVAPNSIHFIRIRDGYDSSQSNLISNEQPEYHKLFKS